MEFQTDEFYVKTTDEMYELFSMVPEACANTAKIAEQCNFDFEFGHTKIPYYKAPDGMDNQAYFEKLCWDGLERRYGPDVPQANIDRLKYEIGVVKTMGYTNYYLIVWDYINFAKSQGIPVGPGRGSGAGSIAAYCVGITDIDPIRYNLIFERFLNPERVSMPDFDVTSATSAGRRSSTTSTANTVRIMWRRSSPLVPWQPATPSGMWAA